MLLKKISFLIAFINNYKVKMKKFSKSRQGEKQEKYLKKIVKFLKAKQEILILL
jgi:hypothetical protein